MNYLKLILIGFLFSTGISYSQVNPHAIGIRFKSNFGAHGAEISYQHGFGEKNRLEIDAGGRRHNHWSHFGVAVIFHWVWNLTEGLNWYIGPGAAIGSYRSKHWNNDGLTLGIGGQVGLEYDFNQHDVPILLSLDWRPMYGIFADDYDEYDSFGYGAGLGIRYTF